MIIKERKYSTCSKCKARKFLSDEMYGCDICKKQIDLNNHTSYLSVDAFQNDGNTQHHHLCSWECVLNLISEVKSDYFVTLPYIYCDGTRPNRLDFFKAMRKFCSKKGV